MAVRKQPASSNASPVEPPEAFLRRFISAMNRWQLAAARDSEAIRTGPNEVDPVLAPVVRQKTAQALDDIFVEFCGRRESQNGITYSVPPSYDPATEKILSVERHGRYTRIRTRQDTRFGETLLYTLSRSTNGWRLHANRVRLEDDGQQPWALQL